VPSLSPSRFLAGIACAFAALVVPGRARADVSSWVYVGVGPSFLSGERDRQRFTLQLESGLGTPPGAFVFGGLLRAQSFFHDGTDLSLLARGATGGFVQGGWGLAIDAGAYERFWGEGSQGGLGALVLGAPWGITMSLGGGAGTHDQRFASATLGLDFARLTVYRSSGKSWFMNPYVTDEKGRGPR
jgi:hypothetical protein